MQTTESVSDLGGSILTLRYRGLVGSAFMRVFQLTGRDSIVTYSMAEGDLLYGTTPSRRPSSPRQWDYSELTDIDLEAVGSCRARYGDA
jgi:hypothetical protein